MKNDTNELVASNLVVAFYSAVEPRPAFLGKEKRTKDEPVSGLDMRNPSIGPEEVFRVYQRFLKLVDSPKTK